MSSANSHARIAPSSMARILQCPGSVVLAERYPQPETPESREGTAAHWVLSETLTGSGCCEGQIAPNGVIVTTEMLDGAQIAVDAVMRVPGQTARVAEGTVRIPRVHDTDCSGTPDVRAWCGPLHLHIWDYKYGHEHVAVFENPQLMAYVGGALDESGATGLDEQKITAHMHVIQPREYSRGGPVRTWSTPAAMLRGWWNKMRAAAEEALGPNPRTRTGPECKYCPARHACPTLQASALSTLDSVGSAAPLDLQTPGAADELRRLRYAADQLNARITGLEAQVLDALKRGEQVPHWRLEYGSGREAWTRPPEEVLALGALFGVPVSKTVPITPKQARDRGLPAEVVASYATRPPGAAKLVPDDGTEARRVFSQGTQ